MSWLSYFWSAKNEEENKAGESDKSDKPDKVDQNSTKENAENSSPGNSDSDSKAEEEPPSHSQETSLDPVSEKSEITEELATETQPLVDDFDPEDLTDTSYVLASAEADAKPFVDFASMIGQITLVYCCLSLASSVREKFSFGFLSILSESYRQHWKASVNDILQDMRKRVTSTPEEGIRVTSEPNRLIVSVEDTSLSADNWIMAVDVICETIGETDFGEAVILIVDSYCNEAICYGKNLWVVKCTWVDRVLESAAIRNLKQNRPDTTIIIMGPWTHKNEEDLIPDQVFVYGTDKYLPGKSVWSTYFTNYTFPEFAAWCAYADWEKEAVRVNFSTGESGVVTLPARPILEVSEPDYSEDSFEQSGEEDPVTHTESEHSGSETEEESESETEEDDSEGEHFRKGTRYWSSLNTSEIAPRKEKFTLHIPGNCSTWKTTPLFLDSDPEENRSILPTPADSDADSEGEELQTLNTFPYFN